MPFRITFQGAGRFGNEPSAELLALNQNPHLTTNCAHTMLAVPGSAGVSPAFTWSLQQ
jgi:hypothetical protein